jgi:hypothetical protein
MTSPDARPFLLDIVLFVAAGVLAEELYMLFKFLTEKSAT